MKEIHVLQHASFEGPGILVEWAEAHNINLRVHRVFENEFPKTPVSNLIILGGPFSVNDSDTFEWLQQEKQVIKAAIDADAKVLGFCLGAQLIADVLGGYIFNNDYKEIGWFPVRFNAGPKGLFADWPEEFTPYHWHSQQMEAPVGAKRLMRSEACLNQAFTYNKNKVVALQFHLEMNEAIIKDMCLNCSEDLSPGIFVQTKTEMLLKKERFVRSKHLLTSLLNKLFL